MIEAIKNINRKMLIIFGCLIIIPVVLILFIAVLQGCSSKKMSYENYQLKLISGLEKYIKLKKIDLTSEGSKITVSINDLVKDGYIKSPDKVLNDTNCNGSVTAIRNGSSIEANEGGFVNYLVSLKCDNYKTVSIKDKLLEDLTENESGLYQSGDEYIFKGTNPNNYVLMGKKTFRVLKIDKDGILSMIKVEPEISARLWDNKYNIETKRYTGMNIFKDSKIRTQLVDVYLNTKSVNAESKKHVMAYDSCIGTRKKEDYSINKDIDCSEKIEGEIVSLLNISDYAMASTDVNCTNVMERSCNNYNYLYGVFSSTWTSNGTSDNTYEVATIMNGNIEYRNANEYNEYNIVVHIDGKELFTEGRGTFDNPYVIK